MGSAAGLRARCCSSNLLSVSAALKYCFECHPATTAVVPAFDLLWFY